MLMVDYGQARKSPPPGRSDGVGEEVKRRRNAIIGLERRLANDIGGDSGGDVGVARMVLARHYSAFAAGVVQRMGGDLQELKALTDRNNIIPLAGRAPGIGMDD